MLDSNELAFYSFSSDFYFDSDSDSGFGSCTE